MKTSLLNLKRSYAGLVGRYRKYILCMSAVVVAYALFGFFLAPWLINKTAVALVRDNFNARLVLAKVAVNPFVLSLRIEALELDDPAENAFSRIDEIFINFQLSSLLRWAWTFKEFHVDGAEFFLSRNAAGTLSLAEWPDHERESTGDDRKPTKTQWSPIRLLVFDFAIRESVMHWNDQLPPEPVVTRFGPISVDIRELNTLPQRAGHQSVMITTDTQGTLSWSGSLQLNPFNSVGRASIKGSHFPLISAYLRHKSGFDIVEGIADVDLDYSVTTEADGSIKAAVDNFNLTFQNVLARTFSPLADEASPDRDVLRLPVTHISGGTLRWPEQTVSITTLALDDAVLSLYRDQSGQLNIIPKRDRVEADSPVTDSDPDWKFSLENLSINRMTLGLNDQSVVPFADISLESLDLKVSSISNDPGDAFPTELTLVPQAGGVVSLNGMISVLPEPIFDFELVIDNLELAAAQPYIKPLADLNFDSGALDLTGNLQSSVENPFSLSGDLSVVDFLVTETDEGSRLGSWSRFDARNFRLDIAAQSLEVSEIEILQPYGDVLIAEDGSVNLGRIGKSDVHESVDEEPAADGADIESTESRFAVTLGRVVITEAAADFTDLSLPLPFKANITNLNGEMSTFATASSEPSTVALEGVVDEFGFVRISGTVTPFEISSDTDLRVSFTNVEMPKLSAYTIVFAGREIAAGKLDLHLGYKVTASELVGDNTVILRGLVLGEKVPHPGAMSLPLGLAVALLKDSEGKIDIDLPVRGNVDDPDFRYGGMVLKAFTSLIVKIVASPFTLLGNLLGVESSELEYFTFLYGRADLTPPEIEKARKIAEALALRPELVLELRGVVNREADGLAMRAAQLNAIIKERIATTVAGDTDQVMYAQHQKDVIEQLFIESDVVADPAAVLDELRIRFTTRAVEGDAMADKQFDELAYSNEVRNQLVEAQRLTEAELLALANARATNTRAAILQPIADNAGRILLGIPRVVTEGDRDAVRMKVTLRTAADDEVPDDTEPAEDSELRLLHTESQ